MRPDRGAPGGHVDELAEGLAAVREHLRLTSRRDYQPIVIHEGADFIVSMIAPEQRRGRDPLCEFADVVFTTEALKSGAAAKRILAFEAWKRRATPETGRRAISIFVPRDMSHSEEVNALRAEITLLATYPAYFSPNSLNQYRPEGVGCVNVPPPAKTRRGRR